MGMAGPPCPIHTRRVTRKSHTRKLLVLGLRVPRLSCASSELGPPAPATGLAVGRFCSGQPRGAQGLSAPCLPLLSIHSSAPLSVFYPRNTQQLLVPSTFHALSHL